MFLRATEVAPISEANDRLTELIEDVVRHGTERVLTKNGTSYIAPVATRKLDCFQALEAEHAGLILAQGAVDGLEDITAGRVVDEAALDRALSARCSKTA